MSFGGTVTRGKRNPGSLGRPEAAGRAGAPTTSARRPVDANDDAEIDWERVALFGTGIALGGMLGATVALLFAPASGGQIRAAIARRSARLAHAGRDTWDDLRDELEWAARRGKRRVGRRLQRARWAAEDFLDDRRRPDRWRGKRRSRKPAKGQEKEVRRPVAAIDDGAVQEIVESLY
jgi:gas vesicle protein